jgi:DNA-binding response OmpR family regulator
LPQRAAQPAVRPPPAPAQVVPPIRPPEPTSPPREWVVLDEAVQASSERSEVSTSDFGAVGDDVSSVTNLPEHLRTGARQAADAVAAGTGKLILVVDDEEEIRRLLKRLLSQRGHRVIEADRGLLALRLVKDHVPDLIILDAMLPELHGFDIARRIKGSAKYGRIPIVMVSAVYRGWRIAEDLRHSYGIEAYLEKPFRISDVLEAVQRLLARDAAGPDNTDDPDSLSAEAENALTQGIAAYKAGQIDAAIDHLKRGIGIDPLAYRLHFHLALLYGKQGKIYEGIQELERAIDLNPKHFAGLKNLAILYEKAGFKNKAVEMWERCVATAPDDTTRASIRSHLLKLI